jgi:hypothetical protein
MSSNSASDFLFSYCPVVSIVFLQRHSYLQMLSVGNDSYNVLSLLVLIKSSVVCIMIIVSWKIFFSSLQHHWRTIRLLVWILIPYKIGEWDRDSLLYHLCWVYRDMSPYKYPTSWMPLEYMHNAINTIDFISNNYRGSLCIARFSNVLICVAIYLVLVSRRIKERFWKLCRRALFYCKSF